MLASTNYISKQFVNMAALTARYFKNLSIKINRNFIFRSFSISSTKFLKKINRTETENQIIIEGVKIKSEREGKVIDLPNRGGCPLCKLGLKNIQHSDILILSQFLNSDGTVIPQYISGLCNKQQFKITRAIALAQRAGLIPKKPGTPIFGDWEKYNTYFKRF